MIDLDAIEERIRKDDAFGPWDHPGAEQALQDRKDLVAEVVKLRTLSTALKRYLESDCPFAVVEDAFDQLEK